MNTNKKTFKMSDLYYEVDYHLNEKETVFTHPEKYGFVEVATINSTGFSMITIQREAVEYFIVGYTGVPKELFGYTKIDKSIINIPHTDNLVIVYNKYQEEEARKDNSAKPIIYIKENDVAIYSRCIIGRINADGNISSITKEEHNIITKYLTK